MKIAITTSGPDINSNIDPRFGRCAYFLLIEGSSLESGDIKWDALPNPAINARGGAGTQAAQYISDQNVQVVISGDFGPNAFSTLQSAGISMYLFKSENTTAMECIKMFQADELQKK